MRLDLADRVAIVTGGSSGIGYAIARALAQEGAHVVITARRTDILQKAATSLAAETGRNVIAIETDTTDQVRVDRMVAAVDDKLLQGDRSLHETAQLGKDHQHRWPHGPGASGSKAGCVMSPFAISPRPYRISLVRMA